MILTLNEYINEQENWGALYLCECDTAPAAGAVFRDAKGGEHTVLSAEAAGDNLYVVRFAPETMRALGRVYRSVTVNGSEMTEVR